jgi:hypothetical protein
VKITSVAIVKCGAPVNDWTHSLKPALRRHNTRWLLRRPQWTANISPNVTLLLCEFSSILGSEVGKADKHSHFVFAAALILLSNEFASLYRNPSAQSSIHSAITILGFCARVDAQAERVLYIVESFHKANADRPPLTDKLSLPGRRTPVLATIARDGSYDPMAGFFHYDKQDSYHQLRAGQPLKDRPIMAAPERHSSSMPCAMSNVVQQAESEGADSVDSGVAELAPMGMETLNSEETEFDFDALWNNWPMPNSAGMAMAPGIPHVDSYTTYGLGQASVPVGVSLGTNVPMYPATSYQ